MAASNPQTNRDGNSGRRRLVQATAALAASSVALGVGLWVLQRWVDANLVPRIETALTETIGRPVLLGEVDRVFPTAIHFGPSQLPPTATDFDQVRAAAVRVGFNPLEALIWRTLTVDVTLLEPQGLIDETPEGWITTQIAPREPGWLEIGLGTLRVEAGQLALLPYSGSPSTLARQQRLASRRQSRGSLFSTPAQDWLLLQVSGQGRMADDQLEFDLAGAPIMPGGPQSGTVALSGAVDLDRVRRANIHLRTESLALETLLPLQSALPVDLPIDIASGRLSSNLRLQLRENLGEEPIAINGSASLEGVNLQAAPLTQPVTQGQAQLRFNQQRLVVERAEARLGEVPVTASGTVHLRNGYNLTAQAMDASISQLIDLVDVTSPVALAGQLDAALQITGDIAAPIFSGTLQTRELVVDRLDLGTVRARWSTEAAPGAPGTPRAITFNAIEAYPPQGGALFGSGRLWQRPALALELALQADDLPGDTVLRRYWSAPTLTIGRVDGALQLSGPLNRLRGQATWRAPEATYPAQGELSWQGNQLRARNTEVQIGGGQVTLESQIDLGQRLWEATARGDRLSLAQLPLPEGSLAQIEQLNRSPLAQAAGDFGPLDLPFDSIINGEVTAAGSLAARSPSEITAEGLLRLSNAPLIQQPLRVAFDWSGQQLTLSEAVAPDLRVEGQLDIPFAGWQPRLQGLDLTVALDDYNLARIAPFSKSLQLRGSGGFRGRVAGVPEALSVTGQGQFTDLVVNDIELGNLAGPVAFAPSGSQVDLSGPTSAVAFTLDAARQPLAFQLRQGNTRLTGERQGDSLAAALRQFPLEALNLKPAGRLGAIGGALSGNLVIDWRSLQDLPLSDWRAALQQIRAAGSIAVDRPRWGYIRGRDIRGQVQLTGGTISLRDGAIQLGQSRYGVDGQLAVSPALTAQGTIVAQQGYLQDLLLALQIFELQDLARGLAIPLFGSAEDVPPLSIVTQDLSVLQQLHRYAEIQALMAQANADSSAILPPLAQLDGDFTGTIDFMLAARDLTAEFDLAGENWRWGPYRDPNQVIAKGTISDNTLSLLPLRFTSGDTRLNFAGTLGNSDSALGQLRAENLSLGLLRQLFDLPLALNGDLNATATVAGSLTNPQARGEIALAEATLNNKVIDAATARFGYRDARLNLIGEMSLADNGADPLQISGSIPYQLPQATVPPANNRLSLNLALENEGLALIDLLNNQVSWKGGTGIARLDISGTLEQTPTGLTLQPFAEGLAQFDDVTLAAAALPGDLTGVTGELRFDGDRIQVNDLAGQFSSGSVSAQGSIPLAEPDATGADAPPLKVDLSDLALNLKGLYNGEADGRLQVGGTALAPRLRGEVLLSRGRISLPNAEADGLSVPSAPPASPSIFQPLELDNLRVVLGDRLLITRAPLLNFVARGDVTVSGPLNDIPSLSPTGTIRLRSGQVNLLTSQFNLDRGYDNIARFLGSTDPVLDVRLETSVFEQTQAVPRSRDFFSAPEVLDLPTQRLNNLQTVQIQATVQGPASQIFNNIELTSSPSRSDGEILALLGGVSDGGSDDSALALAGSALFTSLQTLLSNTLGITNLRLFPAVITEDERRERSADDADPVLGLAAELGIDLTENLSVSALQLLTVREPTQFGLRYSISDELQVRGSTNFSDESRIVVEFNRRF